MSNREKLFTESRLGMASAWTPCSDGTISTILTCCWLASGSLFTRRETRPNLSLPRVPHPCQHPSLTRRVALGISGSEALSFLGFCCFCSGANGELQHRSLALHRPASRNIVSPETRAIGLDAPGLFLSPYLRRSFNAGERLVGSELTRHYRDWILINDVLLPSGVGTTQIDHVLVSPGSVFVIETKELNGWIFGGPGQQQWTQSFAAGRWSRKLGITSKQFKFYNPLLQNEGHAKTLVNLGIVDSCRLRPIVTFVGESSTEDGRQLSSIR